MNKTTLRSTQGHTFKVTGQLNTLGGQCSGLDLAVREGGSGTRYVVKWLIKGHQDEIARNEILLKMTALQAIPQVLAPRDIVRDGNRVGIVTPYLECGMTIEELLQNPRSVREHMVIALQLAHLVALLEGLGIHHGDLSSQNAMLVLVAGVPRVFLIDLDNASGAGLPPAMMMGGEFYAAAERENTSNQPDASSEAYSLAVMLHELLLGTHPFQNDLGLTIEQARRTPWLYDPNLAARQPYGLPPELLHPALVDTFRATLQPDPALRTPAARWREILRTLVADCRLAFCAACQMPFHIHSGRSECPSCRLRFQRAIVTAASQRLEVPQSLMLGRDHCGNPSVSREHVWITRRGPELIAEVRSATSPTWLCANGQWRELRAGEVVPLPHGASLRLHDSEFIVE